MKQILFCLSFLYSVILLAQSSECDFPQVWITDQSSVEIMQLKIKNRTKLEDIIDPKYNVGDFISDSVHFYKDNTLKIFYSKGEEITVETGTYKIKRRKFQWAIDGSNGRSLKKKSFGVKAEEDFRCSLKENGFTLFSSVNKSVLKSTNDLIVVNEKIGLQYKSFPK